MAPGRSLKVLARDGTPLAGPAPGWGSDLSEWPHWPTATVDSAPHAARTAGQKLEEASTASSLRAGQDIPSAGRYGPSLRLGSEYLNMMGLRDCLWTEISAAGALLAARVFSVSVTASVWTLSLVSVRVSVSGSLPHT